MVHPFLEHDIQITYKGTINKKGRAFRFGGVRSEAARIFGSKRFIAFLNVDMFDTGSALSQVGGNFTFTLFPIFVHLTGPWATCCFPLQIGNMTTPTQVG